MPQPPHNPFEMPEPEFESDFDSSFESHFESDSNADLTLEHADDPIAASFRAATPLAPDLASTILNTVGQDRPWLNRSQRTKLKLLRIAGLGSAIAAAFALATVIQRTAINHRVIDNGPNTISSLVDQAQAQAQHSAQELQTSFEELRRPLQRVERRLVEMTQRNAASDGLASDTQVTERLRTKMASSLTFRANQPRSQRPQPATSGFALGLVANDVTSSPRSSPLTSAQTLSAMWNSSKTPRPPVRLRATSSKQFAPIAPAFGPRSGSPFVIGYDSSPVASLLGPAPLAATDLVPEPTDTVDSFDTLMPH